MLRFGDTLNKDSPPTYSGGAILVPLCRARPLTHGTRGVARKFRDSVVGVVGTAPAARRACLLVEEGNEEPPNGGIFQGHGLP